ncbi:hypothetical protein ABPG72_002105 [Tetrahymena utriculariae]
MSLRSLQQGQNQSLNYEKPELNQQQLGSPSQRYARDDASNHKEMSEWMAKKNRQQSEKQIDLILNRINLLKKEQEKTQKKIEDTKIKTQKVIDMKRRNQEMNQQKNFSRQNDGEYLKLLQRKSYEMRRQQEEEREAIRNALMEMKKEERNEVKKMRDLNQKKIEEIRNKQRNENREKHDKVKKLEVESRQNVEKYWNVHMDNIQRESMMRKNMHLKAKSQKDLVLSRLEKQELELIQRLEQSQDFHYNAQRELENISQMSNQEVASKYPPQNERQGGLSPNGKSGMYNSSQFSKANRNSSQYDGSRRVTQESQKNIGQKNDNNSSQISNQNA